MKDLAWKLTLGAPIPGSFDPLGTYLSIYILMYTYIDRVVLQEARHLVFDQPKSDPQHAARTCKAPTLHLKLGPWLIQGRFRV